MTDAKLNRDIKKKVAEHLPEMAAAEMKDFIGKAEKAFLDLENERKETKRLQEDLEQARKINNELLGLENDRLQLENDRAELQELQKEFEIEKRVFDAVRAGSQENAENLNALVKLVFSHDEKKSQALRFSLFGGFDVPYEQHGAMYVQRSNIDMNGEVTKEE